MWRKVSSEIDIQATRSVCWKRVILLHFNNSEIVSVMQLQLCRRTSLVKRPHRHAFRCGAATKMTILAKIHQRHNNTCVKIVNQLHFVIVRFAAKPQQ